MSETVYVSDTFAVTVFAGPAGPADRRMVQLDSMDGNERLTFSVSFHDFEVAAYAFEQYRNRVTRDVTDFPLGPEVEL